MILEANLDQHGILYIDCESEGGINKGGGQKNAHPDRVLSAAVSAIKAVHNDVLATAVQSGAAPEGMELEFALKVDFSGNVVVAKTPSEGQFRVRLRL